MKIYSIKKQNTLFTVYFSYSILSIINNCLSVYKKCPQIQFHKAESATSTLFQR